MIPRVLMSVAAGLLLAGAGRAAEQSLEVWVVDPLVKVFPGDHPPAKPARMVSIRAARGEYESGQVVVLAHAPVAELRVSVSRLARADGHALPAASVRVRFVGVVPIKKNSPAASPEQLICKAPCDVPDVLLEDASVALQPGRAQPVWVTVCVPADAEPGTHRGEIVISAGDRQQRVPLELEVLSFAVPEQRHLYVTNWIAWDLVAKLHKIEIWSEPYWRLLESYAANWRAHRQNVVMVETGLIDCRLDQAGRLVCNYERFDRLVTLLERAGVLDRLELPFMASPGEGGWTSPDIRLREIHAVDSQTGKSEKLPPERGLGPFLQDLQAHLETKGWLDKAITHVCDEPAAHNLASWREASRFVHAAAPKIKRIDAIETTGFGDDLEVWVPKLSHLRNWFDHYRQAQASGKELWFYTCCHPYGHYPNRFLDQPLAATRVLHWLNWYSGTTGYLHWGLAYWSDDPFRDVGDQEHPPGDHFIIYPGQAGPLDSIRWEQMRDGIEDYECLWLLRAKVQEVQRRLGPAAREMDPAEPSDALCRRLVRGFADYVADPAEFNAARCELQDEIIRAAQPPLVMLQCEPPAGTELVIGPNNVIIRGVTEPGAKVSIASQLVAVANDGTFVRQLSPPDGRVTIDITTDAGSKRLVRRFPTR